MIMGGGHEKLEGPSWRTCRTLSVASIHLGAKWCPEAFLRSQWRQWQEFRQIKARSRCFGGKKKINKKIYPQIQATNWSKRMCSNQFLMVRHRQKKKNPQNTGYLIPCLYLTLFFETHQHLIQLLAWINVKMCKTICHLWPWGDIEFTTGEIKRLHREDESLLNCGSTQVVAQREWEQFIQARER